MTPKKTPIEVFVEAVQRSRLLTGIQKDELTQDPELLPEEYRENLVAILTRFDANAAARDAQLKQRVEALQAQFARQLDEAGVTTEEKEKLLARSQASVA